jgi:hypothetical protein
LRQARGEPALLCGALQQQRREGAPGSEFEI